MVTSHANNREGRDREDDTNNENLKKETNAEIAKYIKN